jgi:heme/copper-type cytochrome/quinol oxidase subunit 2
MSSPDRNEPTKKKQMDYFEIIVWTLAIIIVAMLAAYWMGLYGVEPA